MFWPMKSANTGNFQFTPFLKRSVFFSLRFPFFCSVGMFLSLQIA